MMYSILSLLHSIVPAKPAYAHCDIPCGIYTPEPALTAAKTVVRMAQLIQELEPPNFLNFNAETAKGKANSLVRYIAVKEEHAQICKKELLILWTDYFKSEHLGVFPNLHETFWKATKLCSQVKQNASVETARALKAAVDEIAEMFRAIEDKKSQ
ncbi:MAG: superoxide dismutase, Ni [Candidatus Wildermuthbacteria bacterium]|nr:superoxide dismutase, Ni [Candidatus Wildermuthbacteria bacterium]